MKQLLKFLLTIFYFVSTSTFPVKASQWNQLNGPYGAWVPQMAVSNGNIYISCELNQNYGGVYRSTNNGATWSNISSGLTVPQARSIAAIGNNVYLCSDTSIYISTNNGTTWTDIKNNLPVYCNPVIVFLHNGILFTAVYYGTGNEELFYSTNNGSSWTTTGFIIGSTAAFNSFTSDGNKLYAATYGYGIQVSSDNGITWTSMSNNIPFSAGIYSIFAHGDTLYAGTTNNLYISTDGANLWMPANNGLPSTNHVMCFALSGNTVFAGTIDDGVYTTTLGSSNWTSASTGMVPYSQSMKLAVNGSSIISTGNNGIYVSPLVSINWQLSNSGLKHAHISCIFADGPKIFANIGSYIGLYLSIDSGNTWSPTNIVNNKYVYRMTRIGSTYYAITSMGLYSSTDGALWSPTGAGIPLFQQPICIVSTGNKLLAGTSGGGVFSSIDGGLNWNYSANGLPPNSTITSMAVDGATIYANHSNKGVYVSHDAGLNWTACNNGLATGPFYSAIVINQNCIFTLSTNGVFRSCDHGNNWQQVTSFFLCSDLIARNNILYGVAYNGVHVSDNNGKDWHEWSEGLNPFAASGTKIHADGNNVFIGTSISSVWKRSIAPELITSAINSAAYCAGSNLPVNFTSTVLFNPGNKFFVLLSDSSGNFANSVIIDSSASVVPGTINAHIPDTMPSGMHYRIRVCSTSPYLINTDNGNDITILQKPSVYLQPANQVTCDGNGTGFFCGAAGFGISYQWQADNGTGFTNLSNNATYQNVNTDLLLIIAATAAMDGYKYRCIISGACNPVVISDFAILTVNSPSPVVTLQPSDQTVCATSSTSFSVSATGIGLTYKWYQDIGSGFYSPLSNGGQYGGVTTNTLTINNITGAMNNYKFHCVISNCTVSNDAVLNVNGQPVPINIADAVVCIGSTAYFSANLSGDSISFQWEENDGSGYSAINNGGNYTGANTAALVISNVSPAMDGFQYRCIISGVCSPFTSTSSAATLSINTNPPVILQQPFDTAVCENSNVKIGLQTNAPFGFYQWQINNGSGWLNLVELPPFSGVNTDTLNIDTVNMLLNNSYFRCNISDCSISDSIQLTVYPFPVVTLSPINSVCVYDPPVTLTGGAPFGGNYYGVAIFNNEFNPGLSGTGIFQVDYLFTSSNGCTAIASQNIHVDACINVGINQLNAIGYDFNIFPNPANNSLHITSEMQSISDVQLTIVNIFGEKVTRKSISKVGAINEQIDTSGLKNGIYFVAVNHEKGRYFEKVIIVHQ